MTRLQRRIVATHPSRGRRTTWARFTSTISTAAAGTYTTNDLLSNFKLDGGNQQGVTVARIHLRLSVASTVTKNDAVAWGIIRGQNTDVGVNIAGAPQPIADPYEDWLMWEQPQADAGAFFWPGGGNVYHYDIRAKRKLMQLQESLNLVWMVQNAGVFPQTMQMSGSVLLMLP